MFNWLIRALPDLSRFLEIKVSKEDVVLCEPISPISRLVGMPLRGRKYPLNTRGSLLSQANQPATFLFLELDPESREFGWAPTEWQIGVGTRCLLELMAGTLTSNTSKPCVSIRSIISAPPSKWPLKPEGTIQMKG